MDLTKGLALAMRLTRAAVRKRSFLNCLWELTYRCDAQCAMCGYWRRDASAADEQKTKEICRGLELVAEAGCRAVNFTGGEPTLRDDLEDIVAHAARQGMWVSLVTNGLSLDPSRVRGLREAGLHNLFVSLDAADPVVHDGQRGVEGAHERTLAAVRL